MNRLLIILFILFIGKVQSQTWETSTYKTYYYSKVDALGRTNWFHIAFPKDSTLNPTIKRPVVEVWPGLGEQGDGNNTEANTRVYGPFREMINKGWDGAITITGDTLWPIYIFIQPQSATNSTARFIAAHNSIYSTFSSIEDTTRRYALTVSAGGKGMLRVIGQYDQYDGEDMLNIFAALGIGSAAPRYGDMYNLDSISYYTQRGGSLFIATGNTDAQPPFFPEQITPYAELGRINSSAGLRWLTSDGFSGTGHCCWDTLYAYNKTRPFLGNRSAYDWLFIHTKQPYADAGQTSITTGSDNVTLNGITKQFADGWNGWGVTTTTWTQESGPTATINSINSDTTTVDLDGGAGTYTFRITSANAAGGLVSHKDVVVTVETPSSRDWWFIKNKLKAVKFF